MGANAQTKSSRSQCEARHRFIHMYIEVSLGSKHIITYHHSWEVARTVVAPPLNVVKCLWEVFVWGSCLARVCAGVGGVFSVGVSCVRVTC